MAGNKNPWRDIFAPMEWTMIQAQARAARRSMMGMGRQPQAATGWTITKPGGSLSTPDQVLAEIQNQIGFYDSIAKDDCANFPARIQKLRYIATLCNKYVQLLGTTHTLGAKQATGKQLTDQIDVWVHSLGSRAMKKAGYLQTMDGWHKNAKGKYKDRTALSLFLRQLAADNTRNGGMKLHVTPYATIEKIDPYHRQTFVFLDPDDLGNDQAVNVMGEAFVDYLTGQPACNPDRATNGNASFYEWLEYHPFCIGTPGVAGDARYKSPPTISYENHDLAYIYMQDGHMEYERILSDPGNHYPLTTGSFRPSGKGPAGAAAFVWDADGNLWAHEHGHDGFIHASAKQGKKIRCSGMLVAQNGKATWVTNQSGHYAPNGQSIYSFVFWLFHRNVLAPNAQIKMEHDPQIADGNYAVLPFLQYGSTNFPSPDLVPYYI